MGSTNNSAFIYGTGGHASEIAWIWRAGLGGQPGTVEAHIDDNPERAAGFGGAPVIGFEAFSNESPGPANRLIIAVGSPNARQSIAARAAEVGCSFPLVNAMTTPLATTSSVGLGCVIFPSAQITTNVHLSDHVHLNMGVTVSHDCHIGRFSTLCPGVTICGNVIVGERVFVGAGTTIINGTPQEPLRIGDDVFIAAHACVTRSIAAGSRVAGVPASSIER